jgi:hypothetical protein
MMHNDLASSGKAIRRMLEQRISIGSGERCDARATAVFVWGASEI